MIVTNNTLAELISYLQDFKTLVPTLPLSKKIYKEGNTFDQVAFHAAQSANFYLYTFILNEKYKRERDDEFKSNHSTKEIFASIDTALAACTKIINQNINITDLLKKPKIIHSRNFKITTIFEVIQHATAHTAEHYGEISNAISSENNYEK